METICPVCDGTFDVDEDDVDEGDTISCEECGAELTITGINPLELEPSEEEMEDEDEDEDDEEEDEFLEEDEEENEDEWK